MNGTYTEPEGKGPSSVQLEHKISVMGSLLGPDLIWELKGKAYRMGFHIQGLGFGAERGWVEGGGVSRV